MPVYRHAQPAPELAAIVERLNLSGYEYEGGEVTPQNAAAIVDTLLQQLDDAVQGRNVQPAPVVQDEREAFEAFMAKRFGDLVDQRRAKNGDYGYMAWDMVVAWTVWQARAMLQAEPVTTANKLPPNSFTDDELEGMAHGDNPQSNAYRELLAYRRNSPIIPDTWIPVSERIPEDEQEVLTINRMGHRFVSFFDKHSGLFFDRLDAPAACCIEHVLVTHWMPLPAAPQEVKL
ncbi:DUF551 domain-containing protein [Klebsiella aerogenes]|nr:DUF551 domain-containing protein [Klebsiella aerogenes]